MLKIMANGKRTIVDQKSKQFEILKGRKKSSRETVSLQVFARQLMKLCA
jgi:hypothetical protein